MSALAILVSLASLALGLLTGAVVGVAYMHRTFALREDVECDIEHLRARVDHLWERPK